MKLSQNFTLALAYLLGGYVGMLLAFPPSNASPVWPGAGIALAGIYIHGKKVLPGLFCAAFLTQLYSFSDFSSVNKIYDSLLIAAIIGFGSTLQALFGAQLINRYVGRRNPLISDKKILTFLALGGPFSCITAASIGIATLSLKNIITVDDIALSWLIWWVGDVIGVLVFTPIAMVFCASPRGVWRARYDSVGYPMIFTIVVVFLLFHYAKQFEFKRVETAFVNQTEIFHKSLQDELEHHIEINAILRNLIIASGTLIPDKFQFFASFLLQNHPRVQTLVWIPKISDKQRQWYESPNGMHIPIREKNASGAWVSAAARKAFYPITYLSPLDGNEVLQGADIGAEPQLLNALLAAAEANKSIAAAGYPSEQSYINNAALTIYSPVYRPLVHLDSAVERRDNLIGFVANVFRIDAEIAEVYAAVKDQQLLLRINCKEALLFDNTDGQSDHKLSYPRLLKTQALRFADIEWEIVYEPSPEFYHQQLSWAIWWLLFGGFTFTGSIGCGLLMLTGRTLQTEGVVHVRTRELEFEVSERKRIIRQRDSQNKVLRAVVSQEPLSDVLKLIVEVTEQNSPGIICSILLLNEGGKHLRFGAAVGLPAAYNAALDGFEIGPGRGSCGNAAYTGQLTVVENVFEHPFWRNYTALARMAGIASCWSAPIFSSSGQVLGTFAIYSRQPAKPTSADIAWVKELSQIASIAIERKNAEEHIMRLGYYDSLTELPNRRLLLEHLEKELARIMRQGGYDALLYLDLDHFKTLNDSLGHEIGDELLRQVAQRLHRCIREEDTVARLGGDEFVILLRGGTSVAENIYNLAINLGERIQETIGRPYILQGYEHHVTPSIGISIFPQGQTAAVEILKQADTAMYSAKNSGRNTICFYHADMQKKADRRLEIEKDIRNALAQRQFNLHYQPQFDLNGCVIGAEALLRWNHPEKGTVLPAEFISIAEETGLILLLSEWVIRDACRQIKEWPELQHLSLNISPRHFRQADFVERFQDILASSGAPARQLILELTENCLIENTEDTIAKMKTLQQMHVGFSIDDFGTGYSSLAYLKSLPLNQLKIDQSFIRDICIDQNDAVIVETIILMAGSLGLNVIAEGVENEAQFRFLKERGCSVFQGYYFGRPLSAEGFGALLRRGNKLAVGEN